MSSQQQNRRGSNASRNGMSGYHSGGRRNSEGPSALAASVPGENAVSSWIRRHFKPPRAVFLLTFVLFLNYVDRGIIAGAATDIRGCVPSVDSCGDLHEVETCDGGHLSPNETICEQCRVCGEVCHGEAIRQTGFGISTARLGVLQSVFMLGYMFGAVLFGHLVTKIKPFRLISCGLSIWVVASLLSGFAGFSCKPSEDDSVCSSYYLMVFARAMSGIGEASLNTLSLPFLDDILDPKSKGFYIGIFYTAIPVGTAFGFMWAGTVSMVTDGMWEYAFIIQAPLMVPFAFLAWFVPFEYKLNPNTGPLPSSNKSQIDPDSSSDEESDSEVDDEDNEALSAITEGEDEERADRSAANTPVPAPALREPSVSVQSLNEPLLSNASNQESTMAGGSRPNPVNTDRDMVRRNSSSQRLLSPNSRASSKATRRMTFRAGIKACLVRPAYVLGALGYAMYTGVVAGLGFYGPSFLQNYRSCDPRWQFSQTRADILFGVIISFSGLLGTVLGGYMVDQIKTDSLGQKNRNDMLHQMLVQVTCGFLGSLMALMMAEPLLFFIFLFFGAVFIFMVSSAINMLLMWTVPKSCRPMANALTTLTIHLFGDVPSPIFIGWVSDNFSPLITLAVTISFLLVSVILWSCILPLPEEAKRRKQSSADALRELQRRHSSMIQA